MSQYIEALSLGLKILKESDFRDIKPRVPQHWLLGEYDRLIPPALINDLKLIRPDAQITLLKKTGHAPFMTHPEAFLTALIPFLNTYA